MHFYSVQLKLLKVLWIEVEEEEEEEEEEAHLFLHFVLHFVLALVLELVPELDVLNHHHAGYAFFVFYIEYVHVFLF